MRRKISWTDGRTDGRTVVKQNTSSGGAGVLKVTVNVLNDNVESFETMAKDFKVFIVKLIRQLLHLLQIV
jgi:hypothetical protein